MPDIFDLLEDKLKDVWENKRKHYWADPDILNARPDGSYEETPTLPPDVDHPAQLCGSKLDNGNHLPCIDIDLPCQLFPSTTPGHFHLYIDHEVSQERYNNLLVALYECGIVERGILRQLDITGQTWLRLPHIKKDKSKQPKF